MKLGATPIVPVTVVVKTKVPKPVETKLEFDTPLKLYPDSGTATI